MHIKDKKESRCKIVTAFFLPGIFGLFFRFECKVTEYRNVYYSFRIVIKGYAYAIASLCYRKLIAYLRRAYENTLISRKGKVIKTVTVFNIAVYTPHH